MKLLFLHGLGQDKTAWEQTVNRLNAENSECLDVMPQDVNQPSFKELADRLEQKVIEEEQPVMICGLSLGAILALELYIRQPEKIAGLVLIAPQYNVPALLIDIQNIIFKFMPDHIFAQISLSKQQMISLTSSMKQLDYSSKMTSISCPVHVVCGSRDRANRSAAIKLNKLLPQSTLHVVQHAKHEVNKDNPNALAKIINAAYTDFVNC